MADSFTRPTITLELIAERRSEAAFGAFPPNRVPHRLTTAEMLADADRRHARDCRPAGSQLVRHEITADGIEPRRSFALTFHYADGSTQYFAPHAGR